MVYAALLFGYRIKIFEFKKVKKSRTSHHMAKPRVVSPQSDRLIKESMKINPHSFGGWWDNYSRINDFGGKFLNYELQG